VLTTSSCGSNPDGDGDVVGTQKCRCMMQTCSLAHWRQPYVCALNAEKAALLGCGRTQILLSHICFIVRAGFSFAAGNTGKHNTMVLCHADNTVSVKLKLSACYSAIAIASVPTFTGMFACI